MRLASPPPQADFTKQLLFRDLKSYLLALGIFCGGYLSNSLLDGVVGAAEKYFRVQILDSYKTDSDGYIICSPEKPKITNAGLTPITLNASGQ